MRKLLLLLFIVPTIAQAAVTLDAGHSLYGNLIGYWSFSDGSGIAVADDFASNDGAFVNTPTWTTGQVNGALEFTGNEATEDHVTLTDIAALEFGDASNDSPFTFIVWADTDVNTAAAQPLICKADHTSAGNQEYIFDIEPTGGYNHLVISCYDGSTAQKISVKSTNPVASGLGDVAPHMFAVTYSGSSAYTGFLLYVDGASVAVTNNSVGGSYVAMEPQTSDVRFGALFFDDEANDYFWDGKISQIIVFDKVLSSGEILNLYNNPTDMEDSGDTSIVPIQQSQQRRRR